MADMLRNIKLDKLKEYMDSCGIDTFFVCSKENRRYITEFTGSNGIAVITINENILLTDSRYTEQATKQAANFRIVTYNLSPFDTVKNILKYTNTKKIGYESKLLTDYEIRSFRGIDEAFEWIPTEDVILNIRKIKSEYEINNIKMAAQIADMSLMALVKTMKKGMTERDVAVELEYLMKKNFSDNPAFDTIAVSGKRTSLPHGIPTDKPLEKGDLLTIDFGATYNGYMSDMTRTVWIGEPDKELQDIFNIVEESMQAAYGAIKAGIKCLDIDKAHRDIFLRYDLEQYSLRGLGHGVGLQIHELPRIVMYNEEVLEENMVFTVEPGLYIPNVGGVRTEDTIVLTKSGIEIITKSPKKIVID